MLNQFLTCCAILCVMAGLIADVAINEFIMEMSKRSWRTKWASA